MTLERAAMTWRMTAPMIFISSKENLSPRAKLHGAHDGSTFPLICGIALSILSNPRGKSVVPQCTHGLEMSASTSCVDRSQASTRWYAFLKNTARPLSDFAYFLFLADALARCSSVISDHLSVLFSRPAFRARWQARHSYAIPSGRLASFKKNSLVAGNSCLHRWHWRCVSVLALLMFMAHILPHGPHFELA